MKARVPRPQKVAQEIYRELRALGDSEMARSVQRFFKEAVPALGVEAPRVRQVVRDWLKKVRQDWSLEDAVELCSRLLEKKEIEARSAGILVVSGFQNQFDTALLERAATWLETRCDNWALVDVLSTAVLSPLLEKFPKLIRKLRPWVSSSTPWVRRGAAVALVPGAAKGRGLDAAYDTAQRLLDDDEDLIQKAVGWLLREAGKSDSRRLEEFLIDNGPRVPRTSLRYAIERFPSAKRKALLETTRQ